MGNGLEREGRKGSQSKTGNSKCEYGDLSTTAQKRASGRDDMVVGELEENG